LINNIKNPGKCATSPLGSIFNSFIQLINDLLRFNIMHHCTKCEIFCLLAKTGKTSGTKILHKNRLGLRILRKNLSVVDFLVITMGSLLIIIYLKKSN